MRQWGAYDGTEVWELGVNLDYIGWKVYLQFLEKKEVLHSRKLKINYKKDDVEITLKSNLNVASSPAVTSNLKDGTLGPIINPTTKYNTCI